MSKYLLAIGAAFAVMAAWSAVMVKTGVQSEKVRVEKIGKKLDAKARVARKRIEEKKPEQVRVDLQRYCRDCAP